MARKLIVRGVSLSGKTRLTYREAVALLGAANLGLADIEADMKDEDGFGTYEPDEHHEGMRAVGKLKAALRIAGGYDDAGHLYDPFEAESS